MHATACNRACKHTYTRTHTHARARSHAHTHTHTHTHIHTEGGSDPEAKLDISSAPFLNASLPCLASATSSVTDRLSYSEYERKILVGGGDISVQQDGRQNTMRLAGGEVEVIQVPKLPDVKLMHASVLSARMPGVWAQVRQMGGLTET